MRILIDECVDPRVKLLVGAHQSATVHEKGWGALDDGTLLALAEKEFDVLLTIDGKMEFQQNIPKFRIGVVVVHVLKNQMAHYRVVHEDLLIAVEQVQPGHVLHVRVPPV